MPKRSVNADFSACTPAPPEWISVPSMSKSSRRFWVTVISSLPAPKAFAVAFARATESLAGSLERGCVHRKHRDHAAKKYQRQNGQADKNCRAKRVLLFFLVREWGRVYKIARYCAQFRRLDDNLLGRRQRVRPARVWFVAGFGGAKSNPIVDAQRRFRDWDTIDPRAIGRIQIF